ncbi:hypothetical protein TWF506_010310 [Arthrobotrys conoides]|uniref:Uncharacterized protein n=1 Tax=Arthrobotrys conoides TaxID=74498 RepID=A0AAN8N8A2_9PEZI
MIRNDLATCNRLNWEVQRETQRLSLLPGGALVHNYRVRRELRPPMWDYYALKLSGFRLELFLSAWVHTYVQVEPEFNMVATKNEVILHTLHTKRIFAPRFEIRISRSIFFFPRQEDPPCVGAKRS